MIALDATTAGAALGLPPLKTAVTGVSVDTRTLRKGDLFFALAGERFDGHQYVLQALRNGACGAVVSTGHGVAALEEAAVREWEDRIYEVESPLLALGRMARAVRRLSRAVVIGVTGSIGKTGTKDLIRAMAGMERVVLATESNLNNEIGVPLTLLQIEPSTEIVVVEMGMRGLGQIAYLADVAEPDVGVITNVAPVHLELLGTLENVAQAKAELILRTKPGGVVVVPRDCRALEEWVEKAGRRAGRRVVRFALEGAAEQESLGGEVVEPVVGHAEGRDPLILGHATVCDAARCLLHVTWPEGEAEVTTPFTARYRLENTVAAAAVCYAAQLSLQHCLQGVGGVVFTPGRGDEYEVGGLIILDDTYNANPEAVVMALSGLMERARQVGGRSVAILGDMLELGADAGLYHAQIGHKAAEMGVEVLYAVGDHASTVVEAYESVAPHGVAKARTLVGIPGMANELKLSLKPGDVVLVKGSRRLCLEQVVQGLLSLAREEC